MNEKKKYSTRNVRTNQMSFHDSDDDDIEREVRNITTRPEKNQKSQYKQSPINNSSEEKSSCINSRLISVSKAITSIGDNIIPLVNVDTRNNYLQTEKFTHNDHCSNENCTDIRCLTGKQLCNIEDIFSKNNYEYCYVKSGATGHTFKITDKRNKKEYAMKVVAYPKKDDYGYYNEAGRPENAELMIIKALAYFVYNKKTPHIVLPITTFNTQINHFVDVAKNNVSKANAKNQERYKKFVDAYKKKEFEDEVSVLISEWVNGGDLLEYIRKNYQNITRKEWRVIFFQILSVLAIIQVKYPTFRHNDLKPNNVLIELTEKNPSEYYCYEFENQKFLIPNVGMSTKLWDFDFACIPNKIRNFKTESKWAREKLNVKPVKHLYYDVHFFFTTFMDPSFFKNFKDIDPKVIEFVERVVPLKFRPSEDNPCVSERCRLMIDREYTSPMKILLEDPFFAKFRIP